MAGKKTLLFFAHSSELYGAEIVLLNIIRCLHDSYDIYVALPEPNLLEEQLAAIPGVKIRHVPMVRFTKRKADLVRNIIGFIPFCRHVMSLLKEARPDVVYCNTIRHVTTALLARLLGQKVILHIHEPNVAGIMSGLIARTAFLLPHRTIIISDFVKKTYVRRWQPCVDKSVVVYNGVDDSERAVAPEQAEMSVKIDRAFPVLATIAQLIPRKRLGDIVAAMELVTEKHPRATLLIIGDGHLREELQHQIAAAGLEERIRLLGYRQDTKSLLAQVDIFLCPFENEGFGLVAIEAMMGGIPVVAAASGALPEIVEHGRTGLLYPVGDTAALAEQVNRLIDSRALRRELGTNGCARVTERFSLAGQMERIERIIADVGEEP